MGDLGAHYGHSVEDTEIGQLKETAVEGTTAVMDKARINLRFLLLSCLAQ